MKISCPHCGASARPVTRAQETASVLGIVTGGVAGFIAALRETDGCGPIERSAIIVLSVLGSASFGGLTGSRVGKLIDEQAVRLYRCPKCLTEFRLS